MAKSKFFNWSYEHRHPIFFTGLLLFFILPDIIEKVFFIQIKFPIIISILLFSSVLIIHTTSQRRFITYAIVVVFAAFIIIWILNENNSSMRGVSFSLLFIYFSFITYFLFSDIIYSRKVSTSVIFGAFAGYFLIGVLFFFIFTLLDLYYPDTINVDTAAKEGLDNALYFSFITLTTIGYGDYAPISTLGQKIAILEGLIGQFYIAAVMATIVGKFINTDSK
jgi:voltage-gated potassium channel